MLANHWNYSNLNLMIRVQAVGCMCWLMVLDSKLCTWINYFYSYCSAGLTLRGGAVKTRKLVAWLFENNDSGLQSPQGRSSPDEIQHTPAINCRTSWCAIDPRIDQKGGRPWPEYIVLSRGWKLFVTGTALTTFDTVRWPEGSRNGINQRRQESEKAAKRLWRPPRR